MQMGSSVLIVGAGIAGLTLANRLQQEGMTVTVIEKARGTGGRFSSKRLSHGNVQISADMGAPSFTAVSEEFLDKVKSWQALGVVAPWHVDQEGMQHYVGIPRNSMLTRHLSENIDVRYSTRVSKLKQESTGWKVECAPHEGEGFELYADYLVLTTPAQQAADLLPSSYIAREWLQQVQCAPVFVSLLLCDNQLNADNPFMLLDHPDVARISFEHDKPERTHHDYSVLKVEATTKFTLLHLNSDKSAVQKMLIEAAQDILSTQLNVVEAHTHRWLYSQYSPENIDLFNHYQIKLNEPYLNLHHNLFLCGDYIAKAHFMKHMPNGLHCDFETSFLAAEQLAQYLLTQPPMEASQ